VELGTAALLAVGVLVALGTAALLAVGVLVELGTAALLAEAEGVTPGFEVMSVLKYGPIA
jgi:hypothetical protein